MNLTAGLVEIIISIVSFLFMVWMLSFFFRSMKKKQIDAEYADPKQIRNRHIRKDNDDWKARYSDFRTESKMWINPDV